MDYTPAELATAIELALRDQMTRHKDAAVRCESYTDEPGLAEYYHDGAAEMEYLVRPFIAWNTDVRAAAEALAQAIIDANGGLPA